MIGFIRGKIESKDKDRIVVDVNGVGYEVLIANIARIAAPGEEIKLYTYSHITDKAHTLFGFLNQEEKSVFLQLINISDIGPKVALSILSGMELNRLKSTIASGDTSLLQSIPRVGKKLAERIIIELKDKFKEQKVETYQSSVNDILEQELISALVSLGFNGSDARNAANIVRNKYNENTPDIAELIKMALKEITK